MLESFKKLGISDDIIAALKKKGFEEPTPIQEKTIPLLLSGEKDIVGQAQTGTGKTAAFGIPLIQNLKEKSGHVQALILTPTRELALQIAEEINSLKSKKHISVLPVYGGQSIEAQIRRLKKGVDIVVGTPGRILDHLKRKTLKLDKISYAILDEADEMLNMGFIEDVKSILDYTPKHKKMLLFSATMPSKILDIAKKYMGEYELIKVENKRLTTDLTEQIYFEVNQSDKFEALCRIIDMEPEFYGLVFCRTKVDVEEVSNRLIDRGYDADALHGDVSQFQRERILKKFKQKHINILVATDVAARGIDIRNLTHVINYSLPQDPESYVHRIGRTGRAGKEGTAITFITPDEYRKLAFIKKISGAEIRKAKLPDIIDVINAKKDQFISEVKSIINTDSHIDYIDMADKILETSNPREIIAALIKYAVQDQFREDNYKEIETVNIGRKKKTKLFVAKGKEQGMTPKKLVDFIVSTSKVDGKLISDVRIFDKFSFITVPTEEAELILYSFKKNKKGRRSVVETAKEKRK